MLPLIRLHSNLFASRRRYQLQPHLGGRRHEGQRHGLFAGESAHRVLRSFSADLDAFLDGLIALCQQLAHIHRRDGEGATNVVEIAVSGTSTNATAHAIANTIATSPLVKTAIAGSDPNWGRILAAAGRAGVAFDQALCDLAISNDGVAWLQLLAGGTPTAYAEADAAVAIFAASRHRPAPVGWRWRPVSDGVDGVI